MAKNLNSRFDITEGFDFGMSVPMEEAKTAPKEDVRQAVSQKIEAEQTVKNPPNTQIIEPVQVNAAPVNPVSMPSDPFSRPNLHRQLGSTQGKKGEALKKTTMRFSDDNWEYLNRRSRQVGLSNTEYVNMLIEKDRIETDLQQGNITDTL